MGLIKKLGAQKAQSIKLYEDHRQLLEDSDVEAVVIAVPLSAHYQCAMDALEAGKHVLTEKLMAHTITQCKEMIAKAKEKQLLLAVGHQRHYSVLYDNANHLVREGLLGDIKFIRAQWHRNNSFPGKDSWRKDINKEDAQALESKIKEYGFASMEKLINWRLYYDTGGGLMAELGSHQLDASSIFLGKVHPIAVQGYGGKNFFGVPPVGPKDKWDDPREIDDHVYCTFEFPGRHYADNKDDVVVVTYSSINHNGMEPYGETVFGSRGTMIVEQEQQTLLFKEASSTSPGGGPEQRLWVIEGKDGGPVLSASESLAPTQQVSSNVTGKVSRGYTEEMEHFCHCLRTKNFGTPAEGGLRCSGVQGMSDAIMAFTSNLAMKHKKRIVFKEEWFDPETKAVPETDADIIG
jgi:predicted dehydrogenase